MNYEVDDYLYNSFSREVIHIIKAYKSSNYDPKKDSIIYQIKSNKGYTKYVESKKFNWYTYKKIGKLKALLLW